MARQVLPIRLLTGHSRPVLLSFTLRLLTWQSSAELLSPAFAAAGACWLQRRQDICQACAATMDMLIAWRVGRMAS